MTRRRGIGRGRRQGRRREGPGRACRRCRRPRNGSTGPSPDFGRGPPRRTSGPRASARKWRRPVKTIVAPASRTAASTSGSRFEPPGWMIARDAGLERQRRRRRRTGRRRRRRAPRPRASDRAPVPSRRASRTASTRLIWPAPMPSVCPPRREDDRVRRDVLRDRPGKEELVPRRACPGRRRQRPSRRAGRRRRRGPGRGARRGRGGRSRSVVTNARRSPSSEHAGLVARGQLVQRRVVVAGSEDHLDELPCERLAERRAAPAG